MAKILKFVEEIKDDLKKKKELESKRLSMIEKVEKGIAFFEKEKGSPTYKINTTTQAEHLQDGAKQFYNVMDVIIDIENSIREIDNVITMKFELLCSDFVLKFEIPHRIDLTGDVTSKEHAFLVPFRTENAEYVEITPEDLKFVLFIKDHFNVRNFSSIELISKENYYNTNGGLQLWESYWWKRQKL